MTPESSLALDFRTNRFGEAPYNGFTVLRSKFDRWFAAKAEEAGALIVPETGVESLLCEDGRINGVNARRENGELHADVVILADGVNSLLAKRMGLARESLPVDVALGVKEILALPGSIIEERLNLSPGKGISLEYIGSVTHGRIGGGFIYTNKSSLSVGVVVNLAELAKGDIRPDQLLDGFKSNPAVAQLIKDGEFKEYAAKLIPEAGYDGLPKLYNDGLLIAGDAAGFALNTGINLEGANLAMASGRAAAEAVIAATQKGDFSKHSLSEYTRLLEKYAVLTNLRKFRRVPSLLNNPRIYGTYPEVLTELFESALAVRTEPKQGLYSLARQAMKGRISWRGFVRDTWNGLRALR